MPVERQGKKPVPPKRGEDKAVSPSSSKDVGKPDLDVSDLVDEEKLKRGLRLVRKYKQKGGE